MQLLTYFKAKQPYEKTTCHSIVGLFVLTFHNYVIAKDENIG